MKNLFVGCKVRIVKNGAHIPDVSIPFLGKVGIITQRLSLFEHMHLRIVAGAYVEWEVLVEGGYAIYADSMCLEPILPSGHTASTETHEECMERLRKGVVDELPS